MAILTRSQERREESRQRKKHRAALKMLKELLDSKERKDILPDAQIELGSDPRCALYLTRQGLIKNVSEHWTGIDGSSESDTTSYKRKPSFQLVEAFDLSATELRRVLKQLKA